MEIHPTALVHKNAEIGEGTRVGAFAIVEAGVKLGQNCVIHDHAIVQGRTTCGDEVQIHPFAVVGGPPQHLKYQGEPTETVLGDRVTIREMVTVHRGTPMGVGKTSIGEGTLLMAYTHVAHDCQIGKHVIVANAVQFAGHVQVEDCANFGGQSAVAPFCRIGRYCFIGGGSILRKDLPPFLAGKGTHFKVQAINVVGLTRHGFSEKTVSHLKKVFKIFYMQHLTVAQATDKILTEIGETDEVKVFLDFVRSSKMGFIR